MFLREVIQVDRPVSENSGQEPQTVYASLAIRYLPPWPVVAVIAVGVLLRLAVAAWLNGCPPAIWDERDYDTLAMNVVRYGEFAFQPGAPTSLRPPLYPALLAGVYALFGEQSHTIVRVLQALLAIPTAWCVYNIARRMYDERTGMLATAIYACYPSLVAASGLLLTESLFTLLLCAACLAMQQCLLRPGALPLAGFGAALALGALTRSVLWLFPPVFFAFLLVCDRDRPFARRMVHAAVAIATFIAVITPWAIRNTRLQQTYTAVDVMGGRNFMMGNYEHTPFHRPWDAIGIEGPEAWHALVEQRFLEARNTTQGKLDKLALKYALDYVRLHPLQTLQRDVAKFFHFWQLERETIAGLDRGYWGDVSRPVLLALGAIILAAYTVTLLSGIFGAVLCRCSDWRMHAFLVLLIAFVCGIHTLVFGHSRYHLPLMPLVGIFAAAAWTQWRQILKQWRRPAFWTAAAICAVFMARWCYELSIETGRL